MFRRTYEEGDMTKMYKKDRKIGVKRLLNMYKRKEERTEKETRNRERKHEM